MKEILIIHTFGLGDMIMFTPTLREIIKKCPDAKIDFLVFQKFAVHPIKDCKEINKIYRTSFEIIDLLKIVFKLRKNRYDISFVTSGTNPLKAGFFSFLIGAKERIGEYRKYPILFFTKNIKYMEKKHRVENNLNLLETSIKNPKTFCCVKSLNNNRNNKVVIGFHIGSNKVFSKKRWKKEYFEKLINLIKTNNNVDAVIFSGPDEEKESKELSIKTNSKLLLNLSFEILVNEISKCDIFINTDSGLGHIASCFDLEIFTIFGPAKDYKARPFNDKAHVIKLELECQPCYGTNRFNKCDSLECLNSLLPLKVFNEIVKKSKVLKNAK